MENNFVETFASKLDTKVFLYIPLKTSHKGLISHITIDHGHSLGLHHKHMPQTSAWSPVAGKATDTNIDQSDSTEHVPQNS